MHTPAALWSELRRRSPVLAGTAAFHAALFLIALVLWMSDAREVMGINTWIKPAKFMASISIYLATIAWLIDYIERPRWAVRVIAWGIATCMVVESTLIFLQAGRGVRSHFNDASPLDATIFGIMGLGVILDTLLMTLMLALFFRRKELPAPYLWGIRLGIILFLIGGFVGGLMSSHGGHTVGGTDGGPGIPFLNWSVTAGDLRITHALGLHGLQVMPLLGYQLSKRWSSRLGAATSTTILVTIGVLYGTMVLAVFVLTISGTPVTALWS